MKREAYERQKAFAGEKAVTRAAFDEGLPLIVLLDNGLAPLQKPSGERFRAYAEGRLLLLSPFPHRNHKVTITRQVCEALNGLAWEICGGEVKAPKPPKGCR